ncbi:MAG TPA: hypothetical protein DEF61_01595 [Firmicutes bacterium]|nr:hypothetical protein [Bacillota bacterium]HBM70562.1 hypothetical protein [Bacillota bacterium]HBX24971.1 hypothetical protein [Bacillota bacterium]
MEENNYFCPKCGCKMLEKYDSPALNLTCPKCGCKIATTKWKDIDLDDTEYEIVLMPIKNPSIDQVKFIANLLGINFIESKKLLENGGVLLKCKALKVNNLKERLKENKLLYIVNPNFKF